MTTCMADPAIAGKLKLEALLTYVLKNTLNLQQLRSLFTHTPVRESVCVCVHTTGATGNRTSQLSRLSK